MNVVVLIQGTFALLSRFFDFDKVMRIQALEPLITISYIVVYSVLIPQGFNLSYRSYSILEGSQ